jgi:hypothetical protein
LNPARRQLHRLAVRLGKTVSELEMIPGQELIDWLTFENPSTPPPLSIKDVFR